MRMVDKRRLLLLMSGLAVIGIAAGCANRSREAQLVRHCASDGLRAGQVVFDQDPRGSSLAAYRDYHAIYRQPPHPPLSAAVASPLGYVPAAWMELHRRLTNGGPRPDATLFMGLLRSPGGNVRLVCVDLVIYPQEDRLISYFRTSVIDPGGRGQPPRLVALGSPRPGEGVPEGVQRDFGFGNFGIRYDHPRAYGRIMAGQASPADPSRFTIPALIGWWPGHFLHGRLNDDETVSFSMTSLPGRSRTHDQTFPTPRERAWFDRLVLAARPHLKHVKRIEIRLEEQRRRERGAPYWERLTEGTP